MSTNNVLFTIKARPFDYWFIVLNSMVLSIFNNITQQDNVKAVKSYLFSMVKCSHISHTEYNTILLAPKRLNKRAQRALERSPESEDF